MTYYNEIDPYAAQWIRNLAAAGHVSTGTVDERSIADVRATDLVGATRAHFFAGIGAWDYALRLAGWPDDRPVWTGSCPCQPFSVAGKSGGFNDDRHLWPEFFRLIRECRPYVVFGEQVSSADGRTWLDAVSADLESAGYAVGAIVANSASVGAPHGRHRIYFVGKLVANADPGRWGPQRVGGDGRPLGGWASGSVHAPADADPGVAGLLAHSAVDRRHEVDPLNGRSRSGSRAQRLDERSADGGAGLLGDPAEQRRGETGSDPRGRDASPRAKPIAWGGNAGPLDPWRDLDWIPCRDGKARPVEPGTTPLAPRTSGRVDRLRPGFDGSTSYPAKGPLKGFGNAVTAQVAATFIRAFMETE